ncbi:transglycosylase domain-containing protein [Saccharomonospora iraqiensis]|uniref:transglycosylase domain-containing protein n=1 Tax=Saccharomonospora iraqiensis TaxID=52698 RepID=UPI00022E752C|nr:transglycosylase domain-containing protein [Saccharomonospora iraqiensis]
MRTLSGVGIRSGLFKMVGLCLLAGVLVAGLLFPVVGAAGVVSNQASDTVESMSSNLADEPPPLITNITDRDGERIATVYDQYRIPTAPDEISEAMKWAIISIEDRRFYDHPGVDWKGTMRAAISNSAGGDTQGASTLTQQYVKNYLINVTYRNDELGQQKAQEVSIARKLKEARIAMQLETKMSKPEILAGYLNIIEFSREIFGVGAAAKAYFGTTAAELTVPQAALLAGAVNNPAVLDPWNNPEGAKKRRNIVLDTMVGNQKLAREDAERIKKEPLGVLPDGPDKAAANCTGAESGFFCQYVIEYLYEHGMQQDDLLTGGYTIRTTLDAEVNHQAAQAAKAEVDQDEPNVANTLSLVKPGKDRHEVLSLAANRDYGPDPDQGQTMLGLPYEIMNVTGTGSSYKIFTAAAALEQRRYGIFDEVRVPGSYTSHVFTGGGQEGCPGIAWCIRNAGDYPGSMTLQDALAKSPNTAFVILEEEVGMGPVVNMAEKLGLRKTMRSNTANGGEVNPDSDNVQYNQSQKQFFGPEANDPGEGSFTLGVSPTSGLELGNVAATIMSGGVWCPPTPILEISDRDGAAQPIEEQSCEQAVPEGLADSLAVGLSKDTAAGGTAHAAAESAGWDRPMIGKTGTTQESGSAAFIGATPQIAGAAMVFRPTRPYGGLLDGGPGNVTAVSPGSGNMFGGKTPARTWFRAVQPALEGEPAAPLPEPHPRYADIR